MFYGYIGYSPLYFTDDEAYVRMVLKAIASGRMSYCDVNVEYVYSPKAVERYRVTKEQGIAVLDFINQRMEPGDALCFATPFHAATSFEELEEIAITAKQKGITLNFRRGVTIGEKGENIKEKLFDLVKAFCEFLPSGTVGYTPSEQDYKAKNKPGRPSKITQEQKARIISQVAHGAMSYAEIAKREGVSKGSISNILRAYKKDFNL